MAPRKLRQHLDKYLKSQIAGKRQENKTYKWNFEIKKSVHISFNCEENCTKVCN